MSPPRKTHRRWRCPECGQVYRSPLPAIEVECGRRPKHRPGKPRVRMRPYPSSS